MEVRTALKGLKKMNDKKFYWLKLKRDFFKRHDVRILEGMENGHEMVLTYIKMLCESIDHEGKLRFNEDYAYTPSMLATLFDTTEEKMKSFLDILRKLQLLTIDDDGTIFLTKFNDFVGYESDAAVKKRKQRELPTLTNGSKRLNGSAIVTPDGKTHTVDEKRYGGHGMQALDRAYGKCELCGTNKDIVIHHNNGLSSELDDLVCLCVSCHGKAHNKRNGGHVDIDRPPYVHHLSTECPPLVQQMSTQRKEIRDKRKEIRDKNTDIFLEKQKFIPPTVEEVYSYCEGRHNNINPQLFVDYYESRGWKNIEDWQAAVRAWENYSAEREII